VKQVYGKETIGDETRGYGFFFYGICFTDFCTDYYCVSSDLSGECVFQQPAGRDIRKSLAASGGLYDKRI